MLNVRKSDDLTIRPLNIHRQSAFRDADAGRCAQLHAMLNFPGNTLNGGQFHPPSQFDERSDKRRPGNRIAIQGDFFAVFPENGYEPFRQRENGRVCRWYRNIFEGMFIGIGCIRQHAGQPGDQIFQAISGFLNVIRHENSFGFVRTEADDCHGSGGLADLLREHQMVETDLSQIRFRAGNPQFEFDNAPGRARFRDCGVLRQYIRLETLRHFHHQVGDAGHHHRIRPPGFKKRNRSLLLRTEDDLES